MSERTSKSPMGRGNPVPEDGQEYSDHAYAQLEQIKESASAEGYPVPSDNMIADARRVLDWMMGQVPFDYDIDPDEDGGILILAMHQKIYVSIILSTNGRDKCFVDCDDGSRFTTFTDRDDVCGTFLKQALQDLRRLTG